MGSLAHGLGWCLCLGVAGAALLAAQHPSLSTMHSSTRRHEHLEMMSSCMLGSLVRAEGVTSPVPCVHGCWQGPPATPMPSSRHWVLSACGLFSFPFLLPSFLLPALPPSFPACWRWTSGPRPSPAPGLPAKPLVFAEVIICTALGNDGILCFAYVLFAI